MKARCPHCHYEYDNIELSDIGCQATCATCEKEFIIHEFPSPQDAAGTAEPDFAPPLLTIEEIEHLRLEREFSKDDAPPAGPQPKKNAHSAPAPAYSAAVPAASSEAADPSAVARTLSRRYNDAYAAVAALVKVGQVTRTLGQIIMGIGLVLGALAAYKSFGADKAGLSSLFIGGTIILIGGIALYVWGVLITTVTQVFQTIIDIAINSSPLMTTEEKTSILS
jgi:hypothetical protein